MVSASSLPARPLQNIFGGGDFFFMALKSKLDIFFVGVKLFFLSSAPPSWPWNAPPPFSSTFKPRAFISLIRTLNEAGMFGFWIFSPDNGLKRGRAAGDVVRFNRQHFLQSMTGAVSFQRPYFHFSEALASELRFSAERLLGN